LLPERSEQALLKKKDTFCREISGACQRKKGIPLVPPFKKKGDTFYRKFGIKKHSYPPNAHNCVNGSIPAISVDYL
jgi:hypothetical protein